MATITITVNDANIADVRDTLCVRWGADPAVVSTNPLKVAFLKERIARFIKDEYKIAKGETAVVQSVDVVREAARTAAENVDIQ